MILQAQVNEYCWMTQLNCWAVRCPGCRRLWLIKDGNCQTWQCCRFCQQKFKPERASFLTTQPLPPVQQHNLPGQLNT